MARKVWDQRDLPRLKTRPGAGPHKDKRHKQPKPRAVAKRRAWELE